MPVSVGVAVDSPLCEPLVGALDTYFTFFFFFTGLSIFHGLSV